MLHSRSAYLCPLPVVVIGNISVGGTGKTPTIIAIAKYLKGRGRRPVVISRGYGASGDQIRLLPRGASPREFGDEPVLISESVDCPVVVGHDRVAAARYAVQQALGDIILSDDGLQHYKLGRSYELAVIDSQRRLGNGWRLPVGPLRESATRLRAVDAVLLNGPSFEAPWLPWDKSFSMNLQPAGWRHVRSGRVVALENLNIGGACAVAGIGNPARFFSSLAALGFTGTTRAFADHHDFQPADLVDLQDATVLMTEKDAVKVRGFAADGWWALVVDAVVPEALMQRILELR